MEHDDPLSPTWFSSDSRLSAARELSSGTANTNGTGPSHRHLSGLHLPHISQINSMPGPHHRQRYAGDGFDFRRPAQMSRRPSPSSLNNEATVIDLTNDDTWPSTSNSRRPNPLPQRAPRFPRNIMDTQQEIIDLDDEEEDEMGGGGAGASRPVAPSDSPEIEFVSSRRIPPRLRNSDDDLEITGSAPVPEERRRTPRDSLENFVGMIRQDIMAENNLLPHLRARIMAVTRMPHTAPVRTPRQPGSRAGVFVAPVMEYDLVGFNMGLEGNQPPPPTPPTYNAPEAAHEGFTRTVKEEDTLVCPNCGDELCTGTSDIKKQVWIIKGCGHVYCGECTANRSSSRKTVKGKERVAPEQHRPFKQCVVGGCEKKVTNRSQMIQVFL
ncbi:hypothetical protein B0J11DRAFT_585001 [Dendryphion nanum]|uniref:Uncharacterized protein n=1 Tax=Dendryphion nanum TaxID=256645 RepID=A0A9P9IBL9_9PLEO|nr:hypothetical protein B0J11DRAFT_585001 [Dendryphion nanum]